MLSEPIRERIMLQQVLFPDPVPPATPITTGRGAMMGVRGGVSRRGEDDEAAEDDASALSTSARPRASRYKRWPGLLSIIYYRERKGK